MNSCSQGETRDNLIRILLILLPAILIYMVIRWFQKASPTQVRRWFKMAGWVVAVTLVLVLLGTGKLNWLFAMLGVAIAFIVRLTPVILRYAPQLHRLWLVFIGEKQQNQQQANRPPSRRSGMSKTEALDVLGLKPGATREEIVDAHRKLISKLHPDKGGSDYLAAQINLAKKVLLSS